MKRQPTEGEKIPTNDVTDKRLISKVYIQLTQLYIKKKKKKNEKQKNKKPNQKIGRRPKQTTIQKRHTDGLQAHEKMLNITKH